MKAIMEELEDQFKPLPRFGEPGLDGKYCEDWHRCLVVVRGYARFRHISRATGGGTSRVRILKPVVFSYLTDVELAGIENQEEMAFSGNKVEEYLVCFDEDEGSRDLFVDKFIQSFDAVKKDLKQIDKHNHRPPLDRDALKAVMTSIAKSVKLAQTAEIDEDFSSEENLLLKSALTKNALRDPNLIDNQTRTTFWELQLELNKVSSVFPSYDAACKRLNLDLLKSVVDGVQLFPWQVIGVAWMSDVKKTLLQGGFNADDTGVGKTMTSLAFLRACGSQEPPGKLIRTIRMADVDTDVSGHECNRTGFERLR